MVRFPRVVKGGTNAASQLGYEGTFGKVPEDGAGSTGLDGTAGLSTGTKLGSNIAIVVGSWSRLPGRLKLLLCAVLLLASAA